MKLFAICAGVLFTAGLVNGIDFKKTEIFEKLHNVPKDWQSAGAPAPETRMPFRIALKSVRRSYLSHLVVR